VLDPVFDECGIAAIYRMDGVSSVGPLYGPELNASRLIPDMLIDLQNRGQLAAGITRYQPSEPRIIDTYKEAGSVSDVFHLTHPDRSRFESILSNFAGQAAIGHVRYATCGKDDSSYAQPFERHHGRKYEWFSFCFNGNVANFGTLRAKLESEGYHLVRNTDTELLMHHLAYAISHSPENDFIEVFRRISDVIDGAYSLAFLNAKGDLILARDPHGFRPLCYAVMGNLFAAASESIALTNRGFRNVRSLEPGCLIHVTNKGFEIKRFAEKSRKAYCFFEWVYFSNVASTINDKSVYVTRSRLGEALAAAETVDTNPDDCVAVPVPDTAKAACDAMAYRLQIPSREGLIRNRYVGRTFIEGNDRTEKAMRKYTALPEVLAGKRVFLVEDSIVRSTTLRVIVRMIRDVGKAREVHIRVACPPIMSPCFYGIDMSRIGDLIAPKFFEEPRFGPQPADELAAIASELDADSLRYVSVEALVESIAIDANDLCLGCLLGRYPTEMGEKLYRRAIDAKGPQLEGRIYETT
jgi:amidophosphoribosyltransferase